MFLSNYANWKYPRADWPKCLSRGRRVASTVTVLPCNVFGDYHSWKADWFRIAFFLVWKLYELRIHEIDKNPEETSKGGKRTIFTSE
jgi:hypothetical protein